MVKPDGGDVPREGDVPRDLADLLGAMGAFEGLAEIVGRVVSGRGYSDAEVVEARVTVGRMTPRPFPHANVLDYLASNFPRRV